MVSARIANPRLWMASRRKPMPRNAITGVVDAFDRCDPTRSREVKPSQRLREQRHMRRFVRAFYRAVFAVVVMAFLLYRFH